MPLVRKSIVGDTQADLVDELVYDIERAEVLIVTGGLGPTEDDLTREALAEAFSLAMRVDHALIEGLERRFARRGITMPEVNKRQANVFVGQETLTNERGTAPGFHLRLGEKHVFVFPGVPHELEWMLATYFSPWLAEQRGGRARHRRALKIAGMTESGVEERLKPYYDAHRDEPPLTILATGGQIELHIHADGDETAAKAHIAARERELLDLFGERLFGYDDDYHAAMVMQHGVKPDDFALARDLAKRAMELDPKKREAAWLYAAATDRYLWHTGKAQIYGTQYKKVEGRWTLEPFDPHGVTDDERLQHGVPPLAERLRFIEELNAKR